jgi:lipopolysaccharide export system permease protein
MGIFRFNKINALLIRSFLGPFFASFSVALFLLVIQFLSRYQDDLFGKGFSNWILVQLFAYATVQLAVMAFPIAILIASIMCLGKLGENYELAALKAAGISLFRIIQPLIYISLIITVISFFFTWYLVPKANLKLYSLLWDVQQAKLEFALKPGIFNNRIDGYAIRIGGRSAEGKLYQILIYDHTICCGSRKITIADSARMIQDPETRYLTFELYHGNQYEELVAENQQQPAYPFARVSFDTARYRMDMSGFGLKRTKEDHFKGHELMIEMRQLTRAVDSLDSIPYHISQEVSMYTAPYLRYRNRVEPKLSDLPDSMCTYLTDTLLKPLSTTYTAALQTARFIKSYLESTRQRLDSEGEVFRRYAIQWHLRIVMPMACITLLFIGTSLGAIIRKGGLGLPMVVALGFFILLYVLMTQGRKLAREEVTYIWFGAWFPQIFLIPVALFLLYQSATDSALFDISSWKYILFKRKKTK